MNMRNSGGSQRPWNMADRVSALVMAILLTAGAAGCLILSVLNGG
jgi:hypothetical protein